ncbi:helix-turn-helix domain-containing protein [uncultured Streptococcus sp.]|uniref:helix-turn-helix domain-containing protein n=1 Tax=uncultured Streptococcus sp. TaxID=83427 RepID=UPI0025EC87FB|nr:helix-turn-helix domain-containing protein [uncultured Streptococcus sp.]
MNNLKWLRKQKGLTQEELASELGITKRSYQRIEAEEVQIKPQKLKALADYFGVNEGYILGYSTRARDNIPKLITKINQWADERNLKQADPKIQWMRITEEVGEIRDVLLKPTKFTEPQAALEDAIGDTLVTIIVLAHQLDLDVTECLRIAYDEIKNRKGKMINGTFVKEEDL